MELKINAFIEEKDYGYLKDSDREKSGGIKAPAFS